jgi:D-beta-D-heptose 7-phosphate kinase/D-beta-D-heptose 1-phosphate adenosyltransferase
MPLLICWMLLNSSSIINKMDIYQNLIRTFVHPSVLVVGDLIIDTYLKGASTRLSPEAPVPVVDISSHTSVLGGGTNTAANLKHLGANVTFAGVSGNDTAGRMAAALLEAAGINNKVIICDTRSTIVKTRVIAGNQIITRYDEGTECPVDQECEAKLISFLEKEAALYDAIVIADYNKGVITPAVISVLEQLKHKFLAIDSKRLHAFKNTRPSLVKPNYQEITQLLGLPVLTGNRKEQLQDAGEAVYAATGSAITAVTLDEEGALIFTADQLVCHASARPVQQPNVIGAGDTYISAFTLSCLAGADETAAAEIAGAAAAVAIGKNNTAHCKHTELVACFSMNEKYITDLVQLESLCNMYRAQGKKIVFTNGCFDILHSGHVSYLNRAGELGDILIVGINTDDSIKRLKGPNRPINQLRDRMQVLAGLGAVHHVIPFGSEKNDTPEEVIRAVQPDIFTKGGDYSLESLPEAVTVEKLGGKIILLPLIPGRSTSLIIRQINTKPVLKVAEA